MKLKKPIEVSNEKRSSIISLKNNVLFKNTLLIIGESVFEEKEVEVKKIGFFKKHIEKKLRYFSQKLSFGDIIEKESFGEHSIMKVLLNIFYFFMICIH